MNRLAFMRFFLLGGGLMAFGKNGMENLSALGAESLKGGGWA
jgi:hypothetical protein